MLKEVRELLHCKAHKDLLEMWERRNLLDLEEVLLQRENLQRLASKDQKEMLSKLERREKNTRKNLKTTQDELRQQEEKVARAREDLEEQLENRK